MVVNVETIAEATRCERYDNCFFDEWDAIYGENGTVERVLYGSNYSDELKGKPIIYNLLAPMAKVFQHICSKTLLHKSGSRDHVS